MKLGRERRRYLPPFLWWKPWFVRMGGVVVAAGSMTAALGGASADGYGFLTFCTAVPFFVLSAFAYRQTALLTGTLFALATAAICIGAAQTASPINSMTGSPYLLVPVFVTVFIVVACTLATRFKA